LDLPAGGWRWEMKDEKKKTGKMKMRLAKTNVKGKSLRVKNCTIYFFISVFLCGFCGCSLWGDFVGFFKPEGSPSDEEIFSSYSLTELKKSSAADVLTVLHRPEYELLSQSKSVVASAGEKKKGYKSWLNMVAFNEDEMTAMRKYLLIVNERPKVLFTEPWEGLGFDCEIVLEREILDKPYSNENARRIEILRKVQENAHSDIEELSTDNEIISVSGMLINQGLETVLVKLDVSPALAAKLDKKDAVEFDHLSFNKGKIQMVIVDDVARVKMRLGSFIKKTIGYSRYKCLQCGYVYDPFLGEPEHGIAPGTSFESLPEDWTCLVCGADKSSENWLSLP
jgi:rubredoxin